LTSFTRLDERAAYRPLLALSVDLDPDFEQICVLLFPARAPVLKQLLDEVLASNPTVRPFRSHKAEIAAGELEARTVVINWAAIFLR
jgi:hypothetical protein